MDATHPESLCSDDGKRRFIFSCAENATHGYGIVQTVERLTEGVIKLAPGTMYGSLSVKMKRTG